LVYTGLTRLAKDLLLNVLRNWYTMSTRIYENVTDLVVNSCRCREALEAGDIAGLGECVTNYRGQKLVMAPGSEPDTVKELMVKLGPFVYGRIFFEF
jgi:fucokinase